MNPVCGARDVIARHVDHFTRLIDDLLDVGRITQEKLELRPERVLLAESVDVAVETSRSLIEQKHHTLKIALPDKPIYLDADPVRLSQIVANLLTNAAKYTPDGGRIALSGERVEESGFNAHLLTPLDYPELARQMEQVTGRNLHSMNAQPVWR